VVIPVSVIEFGFPLPVWPWGGR